MHECTPRLCSVCGEMFTPIRRSKGLYCSRVCSNTGIARESGERRGDAQRGQGEGVSYIKRLGRHEHRVVAERSIGRPLRPGEVVHHVNGDHRDNRPENLEVITQSEHIRIHKPRRRRAAA